MATLEARLTVSPIIPTSQTKKAHTSQKIKQNPKQVHLHYLQQISNHRGHPDKAKRQSQSRAKTIDFNIFYSANEMSRTEQCNFNLLARYENRSIQVLGPTYMVSGTRDNPPYRGNLIERLYEKKLSLLTESKLTLLKYS